MDNLIYFIGYQKLDNIIKNNNFDKVNFNCLKCFYVSCESIFFPNVKKIKKVYDKYFNTSMTGKDFYKILGIILKKKKDIIFNKKVYIIKNTAFKITQDLLLKKELLEENYVD